MAKFSSSRLKNVSFHRSWMPQNGRDKQKFFKKRSIFLIVFYSIWWVTSEFFSFLIENWAFGLLKNNLCLAVSHRTIHSIHVFHVSSNPPVTVKLQYYLSPNSSVVSWILITKFWLCPVGAFPSSIDHLNCFFFICHEFKETLHEMENQHLLPFSCLSLRIDCPFF